MQPLQEGDQHIFDAIHQGDATAAESLQSQHNHIANKVCNN